MPDPTGRISHLPDMHRGVAWKEPCRVATTANITIATALNEGDTIDGVVLAAGDRVLVKDQSTGSQNGIYIADVTPVRAFDMDQDSTTSVPASEVMGAFIYVITGTANGGKLYQNTNTSDPTIGTTALTFAEFSSGGDAILRYGGAAEWFEDHGAVATGTEDIDLDLGNTHRVELDGDVVLTFSGAVSTIDGQPVSLGWRLILDTGDGTGSLDLPASVVDEAGLMALLDLTLTNAVYDIPFTTEDGGTTWRWHFGGTSDVTLSDDTPLIESGAGDPGVSEEASRSDHVHPEFGSGGGIGEILISDTPSTPLVFADLIQNEAQDDLVYADP